jgi:hypothetical protein
MNLILLDMKVPAYLDRMVQCGKKDNKSTDFKKIRGLYRNFFLLNKGSTRRNLLVR